MAQCSRKPESTTTDRSEDRWFRNSRRTRLVAEPSGDRCPSQDWVVSGPQTDPGEFTDFEQKGAKVTKERNGSQMVARKEKGAAATKLLRDRGIVVASLDQTISSISAIVDSPLSVRCRSRGAVPST